MVFQQNSESTHHLLEDQRWGPLYPAQFYNHQCHPAGALLFPLAKPPVTLLLPTTEAEVQTFITSLPLDHQQHSQS